MPIKAYIHKDNGEKPDDYVGISLPITSDELYAALVKLNFKPEEIDKYQIEGIAPMNISGKTLECFPKTLTLITIDKLNLLANEFEKMSDDDLRRQKFDAIIDWAERGDGVFPGQFGYPFEGELGDIINIALNLDTFTFIPNIYDYADLGIQAIDSEIKEGKRKPEEIDDNFNYDDYGADIADEQDGAILDDCYVAGGDNFIPFMDMDNFIPDSFRVWHEAVTNFLTEDQKNKGYEYFRPDIDYSALVKGKTGIASLDLAAKITNFCHAARIGGFLYDDNDFRTKSQAIIELAELCENRNKSIIDMLNEAAEYLLIVPDEPLDENFRTYSELKADFYNLDSILITQIQDEMECMYASDDLRLVEDILKDYPDRLRKDNVFLTMLINKEIHKQETETALEPLKKWDLIKESSPELQLFQLLPSDMQVQLELENDLNIQLTNIIISHENKIVAQYDEAIKDYHEEELRSKTWDVPQFEQKKKPSEKKPSLMKAVREKANFISKQQRQEKHKKTKNESEL